MAVIEDWTPQIDSYSRFSTEVSRFAIGLDGRFGSSSWTWDAYYQFGQTDRTQFVNDNRHLNAYNFAIDAVAGPGGVPICRVTQQIATGAAGAPAPGSALSDSSRSRGSRSSGTPSISLSAVAVATARWR